MEKLIYTNGKYNIWLLTEKKCLRELAEFVVRENYKHHMKNFPCKYMKDEINSVYQEELQYIDNSMIFVVRNNVGKIIGSIRVFKWDRKKNFQYKKFSALIH